jgi:DNA repair exonuclease SbcCD nuclease subunit
VKKDKSWLVFADLHLTNSNSNFKIGESGVSDLLEAQKKFVQDVCKTYQNGDYEGILFLGDWTDDSTLDPVVQSYSNECLSMINNCDGDHIAITGNHTVYDKENVFTVLGAAEGVFDNIDFVNHPRQITHGDVRFHCLPYNSNYQKVEEKIGEMSHNLDEDKFNVLLFHFPVKGAELDNGYESQDGLDFVKSDWVKFDLALGGDFHRKQNIAEDAYYVGAPFDLKFGEHQKRGVRELDIGNQDYSLGLKKNPYQYNLITINSQDELDKVGPRDVIRVKGNFDETEKSDIKSAADKTDCYSYTFSVTSSQDDEQEVGNFDFLQGGDNRKLVENFLNDLDISDKRFDNCINLLDKVV